MLRSRQYMFLITLIALLGAVGWFFCATPSSNQQINVQLLWQDAELDCQSTFNAGQENKTWFVEQFQFFISNIEYGSEEAGWQKIDLTQTPFQTSDTVLLGVNCKAGKQHSTAENKGNWTIKLESSTDVIIEDSNNIRFTLGVPFEVNHLNPISQKSPLNLPSMFWVWQTGHKFMRLELAANNEQWLFHLGSTGCKSASVMRAPETKCLYPNQFYFELSVAKNSVDQLLLNVDLAELLNNVELTSSSSCQSEQGKKSCQQLFINLALGSQINSHSKISQVFKAVSIKRESIGIAVE